MVTAARNVSLLQYAPCICYRLVGPLFDLTEFDSLSHRYRLINYANINGTILRANPALFDFIICYLTNHLNSICLIRNKVTVAVIPFHPTPIANVNICSTSYLSSASFHLATHSFHTSQANNLQ